MKQVYLNIKVLYFFTLTWKSVRICLFVNLNTFQ